MLVLSLVKDVSKSPRESGNKLKSSVQKQERNRNLEKFK